MIKKYTNKILLLLLLIINILFFHNNIIYAEESSQNHILILNSYHQGYSWTDNVVDGINDILNNSNNVIRVEYMDTKVMKDLTHMNNLYRLYKHKYYNNNFDVIIASDNDAYEFLKLYHEELFPNTPIVVCGLNEYDNYISKTNNSFTGIAEKVDIAGTIDLAIQLFPNTENIYVISDNSSFGNTNQELVKETALNYSEKINFNYIKTYSINTIIDKIIDLPPNSIIFQAATFKDDFGEPLDVKAGNEVIHKATTVPMFSCWQMHIGTGLIGGMMVNGFQQGQTAANMAKEILNGKNINEIPFKEESINKYIFDYTSLKQYSIDTSDLPKDSIFINEPSTSFQIEKKSVYFSVAILITSLLLIIILLIYNIKRLNKSQMELKQEKIILQSILDSTGDYILVTSKNKKIIHCNKNFINLLLTKNYNLYSNNTKNLIKFIKEISADSNKLVSWLHDCSNSKNDNPIMFNLKDKRLIQGNHKPLIIEDGLNGNVWNFKDITRKKEIEELEKEVEIKERLLEEAEKYDYMKDQFLATISHELKTPLNIILGIVQIVDNYYYGNGEKPDIEKLKNYTKISKQNCYRLLKLINNIIDITKINSGFMNLNLKNYNIVNVIEEISLSIVSYVETKGITLIFDTEIEEKIIAVDATQIERIMLNLFSNSIKFTEKGGKIEVNIYDKGNSVLISVKDSGIGIPDNMQEKIFDRFRQVDSSLSRKAEGSGIGLSLVKSIIELHNGNISLISKVGIGSEFIIELPVFKLPENIEIENIENIPNNSNVEKISIEFSDIYS